MVTVSPAREDGGLSSLTQMLSAEMNTLFSLHIFFYWSVFQLLNLWKRNMNPRLVLS